MVCFMALVPPKKFVIGRQAWQERVRQITDEISPNYWNGFTPLPDAEITALEHNLNRALPNDLRDFLKVFGHGSFSKFGGGIYSPDDMITACPGPLWMTLGSSDWASADAHRLFYTSKGRENPDPKRFTSAALSQLGFSLLDILQIGTNGSCGYLQVFVGDRPRPFGYCVLYYKEIEDPLPTFSDGLFNIISGHWRWHYGVEDDE